MGYRTGVVLGRVLETASIREKLVPISHEYTMGLLPVGTKRNLSLKKHNSKACSETIQCSYLSRIPHLHV